MGHEIIKPVLGQFMHQYPAINLQLNLLNSRVDLIEEGYDLVIRIGELEDSRLIAKLGHARCGCICAIP
jgi:DNA-binding transcriptional LysR family regulator|tara:strand:- start:565 stop:771 length:207 start_codon:yes stop_codon:yes gene_type:complete